MSGRMLATSLIFAASVLNGGCCCCRPFLNNCGCGPTCGAGVGYGPLLGSPSCTSCYPASAPAASIGMPGNTPIPPLPAYTGPGNYSGPAQTVPSLAPTLAPPPAKPSGTTPQVPPSSPGNNPMTIPSFPTSLQRGSR